MRNWNKFLNFWETHHVILIFLYCAVYTLLTCILISRNGVAIDEIVKKLAEENANAAQIAKIIGTILGLVIAFVTPFITIIFLSTIYWISSTFLSSKLTYQQIFDTMTESYIIILVIQCVNLCSLILVGKIIPRWIDILGIQNDILRILLGNVSLVSIIMFYVVGSRLKLRHKNWKQVALVTLLENIFYIIFQFVGV